VLPVLAASMGVFATGLAVNRQRALRGKRLGPEPKLADYAVWPSDDAGGELEPQPEPRAAADLLAPPHGFWDAGAGLADDVFGGADSQLEPDAEDADVPASHWAMETSRSGARGSDLDDLGCRCVARATQAADADAFDADDSDEIPPDSLSFASEASRLAASLDIAETADSLDETVGDEG